jgi:hypothetical protein
MGVEFLFAVFLFRRILSLLKDSMEKVVVYKRPIHFQNGEKIVQWNIVPG